MPVIFASSIVSFLPTVFQILENAGAITSDSFWHKFAEAIGSQGAIYPIALFVLIIGFAYFYTQITFDPMEVANNLKKQGGAIPGIRQGRPTAEYISKILNKITLVGALFLGVIAVIPIVLGPHVLQYFFEWVIKVPYADYYEQYMASGSTAMIEYLDSMVKSQASNLVSVFSFGGTTLLIVVGVANELFRELEAQLTMRNYKGFLN
jgi:preprotein translocase subunit SecY